MEVPGLCGCSVIRATSFPEAVAKAHASLKRVWTDDMLARGYSRSVTPDVDLDNGFVVTFTIPFGVKEVFKELIQFGNPLGTLLTRASPLFVMDSAMPQSTLVEKGMKRTALYGPHGVAQAARRLNVST